VQVDFVFNPVGVLNALPHILAAGQIPDIVYRGVRVLLDKDGRIPPLPEPGPLPPAPPPSAEEFQQTLESFWFNAVYCAKQLHRGELLLFQNASSGLTNPAAPLLMQFQMLLPAFSAMLLGVFFFRESPCITRRTIPYPTGSSIFTLR
jgi:hypothetical protein